VFFESFPIYTAHFSHNGHEVIVGSRHSAFHCYDMIAGKLVNISRIKGQITLLFYSKIFLLIAWCHVHRLCCSRCSVRWSVHKCFCRLSLSNVCFC